MSFKPRFTISHRITADLTRIERARGFLEAATAAWSELPGVGPYTTRIERARGFLEAATLSEEWIRRMCAEALVLEAHHTTHI